MVSVIGKMKPIRLVKYTTAQGATGRATETVSASYNVFAELQKTTSGRLVKEAQTQLSNTIRFRLFIRPTFDVTGNWRLIWAGRQYTVQSVDRIDERKFNYEITATAIGKS